MKHIKKKAAELKQKGYRPVKGFRGLYVAPDGRAFDLAKQKRLNMERGRNILYKGARVNILKIIMFVFNGEPIRKNEHVYFIDGDSSNTTHTNLKYSAIRPGSVKRDFEKELMSVRCYYPVLEDYNPRYIGLSKLYFSAIAEKRAFYDRKKGVKFIEVFRCYLEGGDVSRFCMSERNLRRVINDFMDLLTSEIIKDLENGALRVLPFIAPRPTLRQVKKQLKKDI